MNKPDVEPKNMLHQCTLGLGDKTWTSVVPTAEITAEENKLPAHNPAKVAKFCLVGYPMRGNYHGHMPSLYGLFSLAKSVCVTGTVYFPDAPAFDRHQLSVGK